MKTKRGFWISLFILGVLVPVIVFTGIFLWAQNTERARYNAALTALVGNITAHYPEADPEAVLALLSGEGDEAAGEAFLAQYGYTDEDFLSESALRLGGVSLICILGGVFTAALLLGLLFFAQNKARQKEIDSLTAYLRRLAAGADALSPGENSEAALSKLKNEIYKLTVLLRETAGESARQRAALSSSLADIAHQIKTPLTSALILLDNVADAPDMEEATRAEFINDARAQLGRVTGLCVTLLRLSGFDAGTVRLRPAEITPRPLIEAALKNVSVLMDVRGVTAEVSGDLDAPFTADLYWQTEALTNIIKNAVEHSKENGVIRVTAENAGLFVTVRVRDQGSGIDPADLPHIFERFYKAKNAGPDSFGVGLALAKAVVERDGGSVKAASAPGNSTNSNLKTAAPAAVFLLYRKLLEKDRKRKKACREASGRDDERRSKEEEPALIEDIIFIFVQEIVHIEKVVIGHMENILFRHTFRRIFNIFLSEFLDLLFRHKLHSFLNSVA